MPKYTEVELSLSKSTLLWLFMKAHKEDITLNKLINKLLVEYIDELEAKENASNKGR